MEKFHFKNKVLKISSIFILLISVFICIYSIKNYKSSNSSALNNKIKIEGNMADNGFGKFPPLVNNSGNAQGVNKDDNNSPNSRFSKGKNQENNDRQNDNNGAIDRGNKNKRPNLNDNKTPMENGNVSRGGNNKYGPALAAYSGVFLVICIGIYIIFKRKNININTKDEKTVIFTLLIVGFLLRIAAGTLMDGHNDINLFRNWAQTAANNLFQFYLNAKSADYPPLYIYVLSIIGKISNLSYFKDYFILLLKIPSIAADIITAYFIYKLGKKYLSCIIGILLAAFYIFNPAVFIDSTFWGQVDSIFTLLIVLAIYLLAEERITASSAVFAASVLMKPQGIIFLPILFFELVRKRSIKVFLKAGITAFITALVIILPFAVNESSPLWIFNLYSKTISEYPYATVNGFNFFGLLGANYVKNTEDLFLFSYHTWGMIFIVITTLISWAVYIKNNDRKYVSIIALFQIAEVFTFSVGMHERYLFPAVALSILALIYLKDKRFFILVLGFSITSYMNIFSVLFYLNTSAFKILLIVVSYLNVLLVIYMVKILFESFMKSKVLIEDV